MLPSKRMPGPALGQAALVVHLRLATSGLARSAPAPWLRSRTAAKSQRLQPRLLLRWRWSPQSTIPSRPAPWNRTFTPLTACGCAPYAGRRHRTGSARSPFSAGEESSSKNISKWWAICSRAASRWRAWTGAARADRNGQCETRGRGMSTNSLFLNATSTHSSISILRPHCPPPWFGLCHSMGAAIALMADAAGRCPFERLVLTSPMIAAKGVNHRGPMRFLLEALDAVGMGAAFVPGEGPGNLWSDPFGGNVFTTDPIRFARIARLSSDAPHLGLGGPTVGWAHAAFRLWNCFDEPNFPGRLRTPTLIVASGADRVVDTAATERFAARLRHRRNHRHRRGGARNPDRARLLPKPVLGGL